MFDLSPWVSCSVLSLSLSSLPGKVTMASTHPDHTGQMAAVATALAGGSSKPVDMVYVVPDKGDVFDSFKHQHITDGGERVAQYVLEMPLPGKKATARKRQ